MVSIPHQGDLNLQHIEILEKTIQITKNNRAVSATVSITPQNTMTKKEFGGRNAFFDLLLHIVFPYWRNSGLELRDGRTLEPGMMQRPWYGTYYWLSSSILFSWRTYGYQLRDGTTQKRLDPLQLITNYNYFTPGSHREHVLNWDFFLSDHSSLCKVDTQNHPEQ